MRKQQSHNWLVALAAADSRGKGLLRYAALPAWILKGWRGMGDLWGEQSCLQGGVGGGDP